MAAGGLLFGGLGMVNPMSMMGVPMAGYGIPGMDVSTMMASAVQQQQAQAAPEAKAAAQKAEPLKELYFNYDGVWIEGVRLPKFEISNVRLIGGARAGLGSTEHRFNVQGAGRLLKIFV
ncbi:hypothetical protein AK812_SmicGene43023 [Symbiodinium microadriaticum]|uniref:Uncharacterized protein n=1 Tax=Symbiodinium microadriaticum TaxID=2951 RepID=A0A1Q9C227_SYMMI|nr:hypothetical protein AK812_SmicGene43023 [Symbiodinium microadriaticum]